MSGWTDPKVIAEMEAMTTTADEGVSNLIEQSAILANSSSPGLRAVGRLTAVLADVLRDARTAVKHGDKKGSAEIIDGVLVTLASTYAGLLNNDKPAANAAVRMMFETYLATSLARLKCAKEGKK